MAIRREGARLHKNFGPQNSGAVLEMFLTTRSREDKSKVLRFFDGFCCWSDQSITEFTRRFSCWIPGNRASMAAEQNEAPARGIPSTFGDSCFGTSPTYFRYHIW